MHRTLEIFFLFFSFHFIHICFWASLFLSCSFISVYTQNVTQCHQPMSLLLVICSHESYSHSFLFLRIIFHLSFQFCNVPEMWRKKVEQEHTNIRLSPFNWNHRAAFLICAISVIRILLYCQLKFPLRVFHSFFLHRIIYNPLSTKCTISTGVNVYAYYVWSY